MELFLLRHGETDANADGIVQGWLDTNLSRRGRGQAQGAAKRFEQPIDAIYSSDLSRARQTAEIFRKKYPAIPYFEDSRLRERGFGDAEGTHRDKHDWEVFWASSDTVSIPNAEALSEFSRRVKAFMEMVRKSGFSNVLIVTHGGTINQLQDITSTNHKRKRPDNASITHITI